MGIKHKAVKTHGEKGLHSEWNDDHKQDGDHDCEKHQHLNHVIENRTDWPAGPVEGQIIYRIDEDLCYIWNGTAWARQTAEVIRDQDAIYSDTYTDENWLDIPNLSITINLIRDTKILILANVQLGGAAEDQFTFLRTGIRIKIDGAPVTTSQRHFTPYGTADDWFERGWIMVTHSLESLSAGTYTIKVQMKATEVCLIEECTLTAHS